MSAQACCPANGALIKTEPRVTPAGIATPTTARTGGLAVSLAMRGRIRIATQPTYGRIQRTITTLFPEMGVKAAYDHGSPNPARDCGATPPPAITSLPTGHGRARRSALLARYPRNDQTGPTITAVLKGGPLGGRRIEVDVVEGRPPKDDRRARRRRKHVPVLPRGRGPHRSVRSMRVRVPRLAGEGYHSFVPRVAASEINDPHCRVGRQPRMTPPDARHPAAVPLRETSGRLGSRTTHARSGRSAGACSGVAPAFAPTRIRASFEDADIKFTA